MTFQYEVLSPWAEADAKPLRGISPRTTDLRAKTIGLFRNSKQAARPITAVLEKKLRERFPDSQISIYAADEQYRTLQMEGKNRTKFEDWLKQVDTVIAAVGD